MGKLFTLLLIAISFSAFGQVYQTFNAYGWEVNRIKLNNGLTLPTYAGLPSILTVTNTSINNRGTLIYNTNDSTIYGWSGTQWRAVGSGGGGTTYTFSSAKNIRFTNTANTITAELPDSTRLTDSRFSDGMTAYTTVNPDAFTFTQQAANIRVAGTAANMGNYMKYTGLQTSSNTWSQVLGFKIQATTGGLGIGVSTPSQANALAVRATFTSGVASINVLVPATLSGLVASTKTLNVSAGDSLVLFLKRFDRYVFASLYKPSTGEYITAQKYFDLTTEALIHRVATPAIYFTGGTTDIGNYVFSDANSSTNFVLLGDSRAEGAYAGSGAAATTYGNNARYFSILKSQLGEGYNYSIGGNQTTEVLATIDQARLHRPHFAYVNIGTNDALSGNTSAYYNTQIKAICYKLIANGIVPILITPNPWTAGSTTANNLLSAYKDSVLAQADLKTINTYTPMATGIGLATIYDSGDGHENAFGNAVMGNLIVTEMRGFVKTGISGKTQLNSGGVALDMYDNGYGFNEIASNALFILRSTAALRAYAVDGFQIFNGAETEYITIEPTTKRFRFNANDINIVHATNGTLFTLNSAGKLTTPFYTTGTAATLDSTNNYQVMVVNPATGDVFRSKAINGIGGGGSGTVTSVSVTTANGVSGTVATATTTPAITLSLGAITPTSVAASGTVTGSNLSGTNTGDNATNTQYSGLAASKLNISDTAAMLSPYLRAAGLGLTKSGQTVLADTSYLLNKTTAQSISGIKTFNASPRIGAHNASNGQLFIERFSNAFPYASLAAGSVSNFVPVGFSIDYRNNAGTLTNGLYIEGGTGNVGINTGTTIAATAMFEISSTTKGFLPPRMTATQGSAIASPAEGLLIYVTNTNGTFTSKGWWGWSGAAWEKLNN